MNQIKIGDVIEWGKVCLLITDEPYIMQMEESLYKKELYNSPAQDQEGNLYVLYWEIAENGFVDWMNPYHLWKLDNQQKADI